MTSKKTWNNTCMFCGKEFESHHGPQPVCESDICEEKLVKHAEELRKKRREQEEAKGRKTGEHPWFKKIGT